jgi:hypothetical protein
MANRRSALKAAPEWNFLTRDLANDAVVLMVCHTRSAASPFGRHFQGDFVWDLAQG